MHCIVPNTISVSDIQREDVPFFCWYQSIKEKRNRSFSASIAIASTKRWSCSELKTPP